MVLGVSMRRYARSLEPLPEAVAAVRGISKSAVSERFVYRTERKLAELMSRALRALALVAVMLDGVHFAELVVLAAVVFYKQKTAYEMVAWKAKPFPMAQVRLKDGPLK